MRLSEPTTKIRMKIDPYYQRQKCRPMTLVSGSMRFVRIFAEIHGEEASNDSGVVEKGNFSVFVSYFSNTLEMRPVLLYGNMQSVVDFSEIPKCMTLNDPDWLFRVKFCFRGGLAG